MSERDPIKMYGSIVGRNAHWEITCRPDVMIRLKRLFGKVSTRTHGVITLADTPENCRDIAWFVARYPMTVSPKDKQRLATGSLAHLEMEKTVSDYIEGRVPPMPFELAVPAREYQKIAASVAYKTKSLLVADQVGLGKTVSSICLLTRLETLPALVVTLTHLPLHWRDEIIRFAPALRTHIIKRNTPYRFDDLFGFPDVIITNYHKLASWSEALAGRVKTIIFDEAQELRREDSNKYAAALHIAQKAEWKVGLSATPIFNYGGEFYSVLNVLAPHRIGSREEFLNEWCDSDWQRPKIKSPKAFGAYVRDQGLMIRRTREDVGRELPALTKARQVVDCDVAALDRVSNACAELARIILKQGQESKGEKMRASEEFSNKLRQATGISKAPYVAEFVRLLIESGEPVLLYGWHRECFGAGTKILMYDGTVKPVEEIVIGDAVMGPDSTPRNVLSLVTGHGKRYEVRPTKGEPWICSAGHILSLTSTDPVKRVVRVSEITASEFFQKSERYQRDFTLYRAPTIEFEKQSPVLEPWLVGYWLGDGAANLNTGVRIVTADEEVVAEARKLCSIYGLKLKVYNTRSPKCHIYSFSSTQSGRWGRNVLRNAFWKLGLHNNKHIPQSYKTASVQERWELLAGLVDSDGYTYPNGCGAEITSKWKSLAGDIAFLCRSLGLATYVHNGKSKSRLTGDKLRHHYRISISGDLMPLPVRISRKRPTIRRQKKSVLRTGLKLTPYIAGSYYGFETDGDRLFLLSDFTVVHNCYSIWADRLKDLKPVMFTGTESTYQKEANKQAFLRGDTDLIFMSLRAGAGIDGLQKRCKIVAFGELDWSPAVHEQAIGRIYRDGQPDPVTAYFLVSEHGADPVIADVLGVKRQQSEGVINPMGALVEQLTVDPGHIKQLAERYLEIRGQK